MTGIANRAAFEKRLEEELQRLGRAGGRLALVLLDIDHFKKINDAHGHLCGDEALRAVADSIRLASGGEAFPARYGGEEFVILMRCDSDAHAANTAEHVRQSVESNTIIWRGVMLRMTTSVGVAVIGPEQAPLGADALIALADDRLYKAKRSGRNCVIAATAA